MMRRAGADLSANMRCVIYKSMVAPLFEYCASILVDLSITNLQQLQKLQNQGMRIILRCNRRVRILDMLEALCFMSIKERIEYNVCLLVYKIVNGLCPNCLCNEIKVLQGEGIINTRQRGKIYINRRRTTEAKKMLLYEGYYMKGIFKMYNNLPVDIRSEENLQSFKRMLALYIKRKERENH